MVRALGLATQSDRAARGAYIYAPFLFADIELLLAVLAAEGYHQSVFPQSVPSEEHRTPVRRVVEAAPADLRRWAESALAGRKGKSTKRKLDEVVARAGATGQQLTAVLPTLVDRVNDARQRIAHPSEYAGDYGAECVYLARALRWAVRHCLLLDLGFGEASAAGLVGKCRGFKNDLQLLGQLAMFQP